MASPQREAIFALQKQRFHTADQREVFHAGHRPVFHAAKGRISCPEGVFHSKPTPIQIFTLPQKAFTPQERN